MTHRTGHRLAPPRPTSVPCPTATLCQDSSLKCHARARDSRVTSSRVPTCAIGGHERERTRPACRETCATHQPSADEQQTLIVHTAGSPRWRMARRCNRTPCSALISARLRPIRPSGPTAPVTPIRVLGASSRRRVLPQRRRRLEHQPRVDERVACVGLDDGIVAALLFHLVVVHPIVVMLEQRVRHLRERRWLGLEGRRQRVALLPAEPLAQPTHARCQLLGWVDAILADEPLDSRGARHIEAEGAALLAAHHAPEAGRHAARADVARLVLDEDRRGRREVRPLQREQVLIVFVARLRWPAESSKDGTAVVCFPFEVEHLRAERIAQRDEDVRLAGAGAAAEHGDGPRLLPPLDRPVAEALVPAGERVDAAGKRLREQPRHAAGAHAATEAVDVEVGVVGQRGGQRVEQRGPLGAHQLQPLAHRDGVPLALVQRADDRTLLVGEERQRDGAGDVALGVLARRAHVDQ
mmetsp:Transcript_736/g.2297  ORF Transcript_736/g.2297 Transcript_736/m.2297 type:complete len:468 (-) Transcript_736:24-1427(-)